MGPASAPVCDTSWISHIKYCWVQLWIIAWYFLSDFYALRKDVETASERVEEIRASSGLQLLEKELVDLESKAADSSFWDNRAKAQETLLALTDVKDKINLLNEFKTKVSNFLLRKYNFVSLSHSALLAFAWSIVYYNVLDIILLFYASKALSFIFSSIFSFLLGG